MQWLAAGTVVDPRQSLVKSAAPTPPVAPIASRSLGQAVALAVLLGLVATACRAGEPKPLDHD